MEVPQLTPRISTWEINIPKRYINFTSFVGLVTNPSCYQDSINDINGSKLKVAMKEEMDGLKKNKT